MRHTLNRVFATIAIVGVGLPILTTSCTNEGSSNTQDVAQSADEYLDTKEYLAVLKRLEDAYVRFKAVAEEAGASPSVTSGLNETIADLARARQIIDEQHRIETGAGLPEKPTREPGIGGGRLGEQGGTKLGTTDPIGKLPPDRSPKERDPKDALDASLRPKGPGTGVKGSGLGLASDDFPLPSKAKGKDAGPLIAWTIKLETSADHVAKDKGTKDPALKEVYQNLAKALEHLAKELREKSKRPTDDQDLGDYTLKHHVPTPEEKKYNSPKKDKPLGDPTHEQTFEASSIHKVTGQATDPDPTKDDYGVGGAKAIRTTGDAVTDPLDQIVSLVTLRFEVVRN